MDQIRRLYIMKFDTINPIVDLIDKSIGEQWSDTPNFWDGGVEDPATISVDPPETFFHLVIYGGLFALAFEDYLDGKESLLDVDTRLEYVKYCIPDWACYHCVSFAGDVLLPDGSIDPRRAVAAVGPYAVFLEPDGDRTFTPHTNQLGLLHLTQSPRWNPPWASVRESAGGEFGRGTWRSEDGGNIRGEGPEGWRQDLWEAVVMYQGLEGMEMLSMNGKVGDSGGREKWMNKLEGWRRKISELKEVPKKVIVGKQETYEFPDLKGDLEILTSGLGSGT